MAENPVESTNKIHKELYENSKSSFRRLLCLLIKEMPRSEVIDILKKKKIIKTDINKDGDLELTER